MSAHVDAEYARLEALARYQILDTLPEAAFDRLVNLAARLFDVPISMISLVDETRQFYKACVGQNKRQDDRSVSFCAYALHSPEVMVIPDATQDERFAHNPLVTHSPHIRFYAGAPLITPDGHILGTLCVIDSRPRLGLTPIERQTLEDLAALVVDELELRFRTMELEREASANASLVRALRDTQTYSDTLLGVNALLQLVDLPVEDVAAQAMALVAHTTDTDWAALVAVQGDEACHLAAWARPGVGETFGAAVPGRLVRPTGLIWAAVSSPRAVYVERYREHPDAAPTLISAGLQGVAMVPLGSYQEREFVMIFGRVRSAEPWRAADRDLLESASGVVRHALYTAEAIERGQGTAGVDRVTGLPTDGAFFAGLTQASGQQAGVCCVMVRGLQETDLRQGAEQGDQLLRELTAALERALPPQTRLFRLGGGVFAALNTAPEQLPDWTASVQAGMGHARDAARSAGFPAVDLACGSACTSPEVVSAEDAWRLARAHCRRQMVGMLDAAAGKKPQPEGDVQAGDTVHRGLLRIEREAQRAMVGQHTLPLSPTELAVLTELASAPGQVVSRDVLAQATRQGSAGASNALDVHVGNLRRKLARVTSAVEVRSVRGAGYTLHVDPSST